MPNANMDIMPNADLVLTLVYLDLCSSSAIVEDDGEYSGVMVAVHELAHLLGAVHDGYYGATECSKEGFIMSERKRGPTWSKRSMG